MLIVCFIVNFISCKKVRKDVNFIGFDTRLNTNDNMHDNGGVTSTPIVTSNSNTQSSPNVMGNSFGGIYLNMTDKQLLALMKDPIKQEIKIWDSDKKKHQTWSYAAIGFETDMVGELSNQKVYMVAAKSICKLKTDKGIGVGSSKSDVEQAYKSSITSNQNGKIMVGNANNAVLFEFENNNVKSIVIGSAL
jgi:hypothetical protein